MRKKNLIRLIPALLALLLLAGCTGKPKTDASDTATDENPSESTAESAEAYVPTEPFRGLKIGVPKDAKLKLYQGTKEKVQIEAGGPEIFGDTAVYSNTGIGAGIYSYTVSGRGYYYVHKVFTLTPEQLKEGFYLDANSGKVAGTGYEQIGANIQTPSDAILRGALASDPSLWPDYQEVFTTPAFENRKRESGFHQTTTQEQMEAWIDDCVAASGNAYRYSLGKSPAYGLDIPLVIFTKEDLSGAKDYKAAAEILHKTDLPIFLYTAQIHGNEPSATEGALAIMKALTGEFGDKALDCMHILIVPRQNPDGSKDFTRASAKSGKDMNRDQMKSSNDEITAVHKMYYTFMPHILLDGHEYNANNNINDGNVILTDALVAIGATANTSENLVTVGNDMVNAMFEAYDREKLTAFWYSRPNYNYFTLNSQNPTSGRCYYSLTGSVTFLVESHGIYMGLTSFERRVITEYLAAESIILYTEAHGAEIKKIVEDERASIIERGKTFDPQDQFVLYTDKDDRVLYRNRPAYNMLTGAQASNDSKNAYVTRKAVDAVARPTAYVIPADLPAIDDVLKTFDKQFITYEKLEPGTALPLKQYRSTTVGDFTEKKTVTFENGAYIARMNQVTANVLAYLMEPEAKDAEDYSCSFVDMKYISAGADGMLPIFRSEENLQ